MKLTNNIARFGRLEALHLHINGIDESNFKFLFENCSMLVNLTIFDSITKYWSNESVYIDILRTVKRNCKQIEIVRIVGKKSDFKKYDRSSFYKIKSMFPKALIELN